MKACAFLPTKDDILTCYDAFCDGFSVGGLYFGENIINLSMIGKVYLLRSPVYNRTYGGLYTSADTLYSKTL